MVVNGALESALGAHVYQDKISNKHGRARVLVGKRALFLGRIVVGCILFEIVALELLIIRKCYPNRVFPRLLIVSL